MLAILFVFGFRVPSDAKNSLGYGYTIDERAFCSYLSHIKQCSKPYVKDPAACTAVLSQVTPCVETVDKWLSEFNEVCRVEMNELNKCVSWAKSEEEERKECVGEMGAILTCSIDIKREDWMPLPDIRKGVRRKFYFNPSKPKPS